MPRSRNKSDKPMSKVMFLVMSVAFKLRDCFRPREKIFDEVEIDAGHQVLDFGCGPGSYTKIAAKYVGRSGKVYALDIHPLAAKQIQKIASRMGLTNIETICSGCDTGLADGTIDVVFLYDIFHMLGEPEAVLGELNRVMKPGAVLSCSDHHMKEQDIIKGITSSGLFELSGRGRYTLKFVKRSS